MQDLLLLASVYDSHLPSEREIQLLAILDQCQILLDGARAIFLFLKNALTETLVLFHYEDLIV